VKVIAGLTANELAFVDLTDLVSYLRSRGWQEAGKYARAVIWTRDLREGQAEVLVPERSDLLDYPRRVGDIARTLSAVERRTVGAVIQDLLSSRIDVLHVRTLPGGSVPLLEGYLAVKGVSDLLLAAATAAALPERPPVLPTRKPYRERAQEFLDQVRLGQPADNSYVLRVEVPLPLPDVVPLVSTRDVTTFLYQASSSALEAAGEVRGDDLSEFNERVGDGVSANLCAALAAIGGERQSPYELSFGWAQAQPVEHDTPSLKVDQQAIGTLRRASDYLSTLPVSESAIVIGRVVELHRGRTDKLGKVTLKGDLEASGVGRREGRVTVRLDPRAYDVALTAHANDQLLRVTGSVRDTGRRYEISRVDSVRMVQG
jgi:hypothetical protein